MFNLFVCGNTEKLVDSLILTPEATKTPLNKNAFYTILIKVLLGELKPRPDCWVTFEDAALNLPINEFWLNIFDPSPQKTSSAQFIIAELLKENSPEIKSILYFCLGYLIAKRLYAITDDEYAKLKITSPDTTESNAGYSTTKTSISFLEAVTYRHTHATIFFLAAANLRNPYAMNELGNLLRTAAYIPITEDFNSLGIEDPDGSHLINRRNKRAAAFYLRAGELGCADAHKNLGDLIRTRKLIIGKDITLDQPNLSQHQAAAGCYRRTFRMAQGHADAAAAVADMIFAGEYTPIENDFSTFETSTKFLHQSARFYRVAGQLGCARATYTLTGLIARGYGPIEEDFTAFKIECPQYNDTKQDDIDFQTDLTKRYGFGKRLVEENIFCFIAALQGHMLAFDHFKKAYPLIRKLYDYKPLFKACIIPLLIRYRTFPEHILEFLRDEKIKHDMVEVLLENKAKFMEDKMALVDNNRAMGQVINYHRLSGTLKEPNQTASSEKIIQEFSIPFTPKSPFWATLISGISFSSNNSVTPAEGTMRHLHENNL